MLLHLGETGCQVRYWGVLRSSASPRPTYTTVVIRHPSGHRPGTHALPYPKDKRALVATTKHGGGSSSRSNLSHPDETKSDGCDPPQQVAPDAREEPRRRESKQQSQDGRHWWRQDFPILSPGLSLVCGKPADSLQSWSLSRSLPPSLETKVQYVEHFVSCLPPCRPSAVD